MKLRIIKSLLPLLALVTLLAFGVYGAGNTKNVEERGFGDFRIRPYRYGIFIANKSFKEFYNFSPYDAYYLTEDGKVIHPLRWGQEVYSLESGEKSKYKSVFNALLNYFEVSNPKATFISDDNRYIFQVAVQGNKLELRSNLNEGLNIYNSDSIVTTISFNENNYIFDENNNLYSDNSEDGIESFNSFFNLELKPLEEKYESIEFAYKNYLFIVNPAYPGTIRISKNQNPESKIHINKTGKRIGFERDYETDQEITLEFFNSLAKARNTYE